MGGGGWWRWALVSPDGVAPSQMVSVSASVNLPLHHKVQQFSSGTGSPGLSQKKGRKTVVCVCVCLFITTLVSESKGSKAHSARNPVVDEERMKPGHWLWLLLCVPFIPSTLMVCYPSHEKPLSTNLQMPVPPHDLLLP